LNLRDHKQKRGRGAEGPEKGAKEKEKRRGIEGKAGRSKHNEFLKDHVFMLGKGGKLPFGRGRAGRGGTEVRIRGCYWGKSTMWMAKVYLGSQRKGSNLTIR